MDLSTARVKVGRKTQLLNSAGNFVDSMVLSEDVDAVLNARAREFFLKIQDRFPWWKEYTEYFDLTADDNFFAFSDLTAPTAVTINTVGVKYNSSDTEYIFAQKKPFKSIFQRTTSESVTSKTSPFYTEASDNTEGVGIHIYPTPDTAVTDGLMIKYTYLGGELTGDGEEFSFLPELSMDVVIAYAVADVWELKRDWSNSNQALNRAILLEDNFFKSYNPQSSDTPARFYPNKTFNPFRR